MAGSPTESVQDPDPLATMIAELRREKLALEDQRREIGILVKQAMAETERATQRERAAATQLAELEATFETLPRTEIRRRYSEFMEAQVRVSTWRSQLEQLRSRQAALERMLGFLDRLLATTEAQLASAREQDASDAEADDAAMLALRSIELAQRRLSRQLQDSAAQSLSDLVLRAQVCERLIRMDEDRAEDELAGLKMAASAALKSTRQLILELQPPALEELGLVAGLQRYAEASRSAEKLRIDLEVSGQERRLPPGTETALFRIAQEALSNAARHSGAGQATVRLRFETEQVVATIADSGQGFDVAAVLASARQREHSGLLDMRLRAAMVGGTLEVSSKPGAGCMVSAAVPI